MSPEVLGQLLPISGAGAAAVPPGDPPGPQARTARSRSCRKRLSVGDEVMLTSGIFGTVDRRRGRPDPRQDRRRRRADRATAARSREIVRDVPADDAPAYDGQTTRRQRPTPTAAPTTPADESHDREQPRGELTWRPRPRVRVGRSSSSCSSSPACSRLRRRSATWKPKLGLDLQGGTADHAAGQGLRRRIGSPGQARRGRRHHQQPRQRRRRRRVRGLHPGQRHHRRRDPGQGRQEPRAHDRLHRAAALPARGAALPACRCDPDPRDHADGGHRPARRRRSDSTRVRLRHDRAPSRASGRRAGQSTEQEPGRRPLDAGRRLRDRPPPADTDRRALDHGPSGPTHRAAHRAGAAGPGRHQGPLRLGGQPAAGLASSSWQAFQCPGAGRVRDGPGRPARASRSSPATTRATATCSARRWSRAPHVKDASYGIPQQGVGDYVVNVEFDGTGSKSSPTSPRKIAGQHRTPTWATSSGWRSCSTARCCPTRRNDAADHRRPGRDLRQLRPGAGQEPRELAEVRRAAADLLVQSRDRRRSGARLQPARGRHHRRHHRPDPGDALLLPLLPRARHRGDRLADRRRPDDLRLGAAAGPRLRLHADAARHRRPDRRDRYHRGLVHRLLRATA